MPNYKDNPYEDRNSSRRSPSSDIHGRPRSSASRQSGSRNPNTANRYQRSYSTDPNRSPRSASTRTPGGQTAALRRRQARRKRAMRRFFGVTVSLVVLTTLILFFWSQRDQISHAIGSVSSYFGSKQEDRKSGTPTDRIPESENNPTNETGVLEQPIDSPYAKDGIDFRLEAQTPFFIGNQRAIVLIDAGHGGMDGGAPGYLSNGEQIAEATVVLDIAMKLQEELNNQNIEAYLIRDDDTFYSLYARVARASHLALDYMSAYQPETVADRDFVDRMQTQLMVPIEINSDNPSSGGFGFMQGYGMSAEQMQLLDLQRECDNVIFISLHSNAHNTNKTLHGMQAYYCHDDNVEENEAAGLAQQASPAGNQVYRNRDNDRNQRLAQSVYDAATGKAPQLSDTNAGRPVLKGNYAVLREHGLAGTLIEIGYMSHQGDIKLLTDPEFQRKLAQGLSEGIANYFVDQLS